MLLEYILEKNGLTKEDVNIIQNVDFGSTAAAFSSGIADYTVEFEPSATLLEQESAGFVVASLGVGKRLCAVYCLLCQKELHF